ncbi:MAG: response regulator [Chloroflexi bacterium]|nr:response regulator [Chloroflexota bacterium]
MRCSRRQTARWRSISSDGNPRDAILLDLDLPVLDGLNFAHAYRQLSPPHAPIIVVSALTNTAAQAARIRASEYVLKPFDVDELVRLVERFTT